MPKLLADLTPLKTPSYRRLWLAGVVSQLGAQFTVVAVPTQLYQLTHSSAYVGLAGLFALLPMLVLAPLGGVLADLHDRRRILIVTSAGLAATSVLLWAQAALPSALGGIAPPLGGASTQIWLVLGLFALQQAFFSVNNPARGAIIPLLLPAEQLAAANALHFTIVGLTAFAGPMLGGLLLAVPGIGLSRLYLIDAATMCATVVAAIRLPTLRQTLAGDQAGTPESAADRRAGPGSVHEAVKALFEGFSHLRADQILLATFVADLIAMVFGLPRALFPEIAHTILGGPTAGGSQLGLLYAAVPVGAFLGGLFSGWVPRVRRQGLAVLLAVAAWGAGVAGFGGSLSLWGAAGLWAALACLAAAGLADAFSSVFRSTMLQTATPDELRGRMQGVFFLVVAGGPRLADALHGYSSALLGPTASATLGGLLVIAGSAVAAALLPRFTAYRSDTR